jgi:hypothetical protein
MKREDTNHFAPPELWDQHTDVIVTPARFLCWGFLPERLNEGHLVSRGERVYRPLLRALEELCRSRNRRRRDRQFVVWAGDHLDCFWVAVPAGLSAGVTSLIGRHLESVPGHQHPELGNSWDLPLAPLFAYEYGRIIRYSDDSVVGTETRDAYSSGVSVLNRLTWW